MTTEEKGKIFDELCRRIDSMTPEEVDRMSKVLDEYILKTFGTNNMWLK